MRYKASEKRGIIDLVERSSLPVQRTLNRHLNAYGVSFRKFVDEVSFEISRQLLDDSDMEIVQIASLLGYSNASAFTRAFRRWSSTTSAVWRTKALNKG